MSQVGGRGEADARNARNTHCMQNMYAEREKEHQQEYMSRQQGVLKKKMGSSGTEMVRPPLRHHQRATIFVNMVQMGVCLRLCVCVWCEKVFVTFFDLLFLVLHHSSSFSSSLLTRSRLQTRRSRPTRCPPCGSQAEGAAKQTRKKKKKKPAAARAPHLPCRRPCPP